MGIRERYRRWKATRGYGVHSPLAFRIVKHVIRPSRDVKYYGEERLEDSPQPFSIIRKSRLLLRFVAEMQPAYVWTSPGLPEIFVDAIRLAGCVVRIYDGKVFPDEIDKADMIVLYKAHLAKKILDREMKRKITLIGFDLEPKMIANIRGLFKGGVLLDAVDGILLANTPGDAPHSYGIKRF